MIEDILKAGNYHLIDVREPMELEMNGAIDEAINIPLGEIEERQDEIKNLEGNVIFFCRSGNRSGQATEFFKSQGLENVYNGGGYEAMQESLDNVQ
ncbi:sulfurtransferase [Elizabethkingia meningoseptica]|uniref:Sulfurtransferase n=1 Tax=Elizabethkingia meningoseptica TaxID=238 RepID=A0A1V3U3R9_ELIME|nr:MULTISPECIES: rhodanese-like domain-containing protein [Elizabethkingia]AQX06408.1 sulfurtransferase [Elizabethkingia meningoseptica]AQX13939.1 sulfurtransferase [Elizabethkingia meningoseptica]AQX48455.1 sulfurtransferase [Elizabethkingia meningoseptica]EJK5327862.1 rhodanese-like domain-containing protein [Elizabethkingia meningoseptica]EOR30908.1 Rhodanese-related sulfurtransferase [Elizabethkingia meningoseptica ATCC 13253 = NBRC 12535]